MERERNYILPYLLVGAALTGLTLVLPQIGFLEWLTMIPLFLGVYRLGTSSRHGLWRTYGYGFLTVLCFYLVNYHWFVYLYPLDFVGLNNSASAMVVLAGSIGLSLLQAIPGGLIFVLYKLLNRTEVFRRMPLLRPFAFAALWIVFEWSSTLTWTGVPWGRLCLGQSEYLPVLQSISLFGSYFLSFLILVVNGLLAYACLFRKYTRRALICASVAVSIVISNLLLGVLLLNMRHKPIDTVQMAVAQGNVSSHDKWGADSYSISRDVYEDMTRAAAAEGAKVVVWPETAFPYTINYDGILQDFVSELAIECDVTILVGTVCEDDEGNSYNALCLVTPDGVIHDEYYAKRHLVPFGEYVPMKDFIEIVLPPLAELSALGNDLTPGADSALLDVAGGRVGGLICFDSIYEKLAIDSVRDGAEVLVLSSNDSWFKDSAAIYQHEAQARLRAIETGRYLVRAGNTGISCVISDKGERLGRIGAMEQDYLVCEVELHGYRTLYSVIGNTFVYLCIAFAASLFGVALYWSKKKNTSTIP
ncbi:MAG: apolipoprotein N-acyltransferase [Clostridia bacterium]|nr:apolipoprotein N-acyltransferase [Clostridia bacterium]